MGRNGIEKDIPAHLYHAATSDALPLADCGYASDSS